MTESSEARLDTILCPKRKTPNWEHWGSQKIAKLCEAVALLFNIEPATLQMPLLPELPEGYDRVIDMALNGHPDNGLVALSQFDQERPEDSPIEVAKFGMWAKARGYALPPEFPIKVTPEAICHPVWPWGTYTNPTLNLLARAAYEWWSSYDPADPSTAPTNEQVKDWLVEEGATPNMAKKIASILHEPSIKTGPR